MAPTQKMAARKQWMADHLQMRGAGPRRRRCRRQACATTAKSLLPIGIVDVQGRVPSAADRHRGALRLRASRSRAGSPTTSSSEARLIARKAIERVRALAGLHRRAEMIQRDNLVLT
jgi:glutamate 5-kinase